MRALPLIVLTLAACATSIPAKPVTARLMADHLSVTFSDGVTCHAPGSFAGTLSTGALEDCPHPTRYEVDATQRPNRVSDVISSVLSALSLGDTLSPHATVTLTTDGGRVTQFTSPQGAD